jgi:hypothetical protein
MHRPQPGSLESHGAPSLPSWVHGPLPRGHDICGQSAPRLLQVTSQLHDAAQSTDGHAPAPEQRTSHSPAPQRSAPHDIAPLQSTLQLLASRQSTSPHADGLLHRMVQSQPIGHCTLPHGLLAVQSIRQLMSVASQLAHCAGQPAVAATTQNP